MSLDANKKLISRQIEAVWNMGNVAAIAEYWSPELQEWARQTQHMLRSGFPDFHIVVEDLIAEHDQVVARMRWTGTHQGQFLHLPPSGKAFEILAIRIYRVADGKIVESVAVQDRFGMLEQLGALPSA